MELDSHYFPFPWTRENWDNHFSIQTKKNSLMLQEEILIGFCSWEYLPLEKLYHIYKILIVPDFRGKKLGKLLLEKSLAEMNEFYPEGAHCFLELESTNTAARNLYEGFGFEFLEQISHFYGSERHGIRMCLDFSKKK